MKKALLIIAVVVCAGLVAFYGHRKQCEHQLHRVLESITGTNRDRSPYEAVVHGTLKPLRKEEGGIGPGAEGAGVVPELKPFQRDYQLTWDGERAVMTPLQDRILTEHAARPEEALLRATTDFEKFLPKLATWRKKLSTGELDGRLCRVISATSPNGRSSCTLWVDKEHGYISKGKIIIMGNHFCTTRVYYRSVGGASWLPRRVVTEYPLAQVQVTQEFGPHTEIN